MSGINHRDSLGTIDTKVPGDVRSIYGRGHTHKKHFVLFTKRRANPVLSQHENALRVRKTAWKNGIYKNQKVEKADALKREKIFLGARGGDRKASPAVPDAIGWINHPALFPETSGNGPPSNKNNGPHVSIATITESIPPSTEKWFKEFPSTKKLLPNFLGSEDFAKLRTLMLNLTLYE
ncbi:hypothetical protein CEXT_387481 [Caerostris extrusa]|uniref:Uncharacterized protein n=1 Tax=Caerostris extrusa TaxID=172846 RepID=A0AAV4P1J7_CAEEX|nr:hypothetical protein CEXT_387481 [Caerostris extrusa]